MLQNKASEKVPGGFLAEEVSGVEEEDGGRQGTQEAVRSQQREPEEGGMGCQRGFWTNPEHRRLQCLQLA